MDKLMYYIINIAYIFAKFFLILFWVYLTSLILLGGEIEITLGKNGMRIGYDGLILFIKKIINYF